MAKTYKDPYTLDGRVKFQAGVSKAKIDATRSLVERMLSGDRQAKGLFEAAITTSDLGLNLAQLVNITVLPELDETERVWSQLAGVRPVSDFRDNYLYSLQRNWAPGVVGDGQEDEPLDYLPTVPEATPYPEAHLTGEVIAGSALRKAGLRTGITFEAITNDSTGIVQALPNLFRELALNTDEHDVLSALIDGVGAGQALQAGTNVDGTSVVANATLSRAALVQAVAQLKRRIVGGVRLRINGGLNLVVPVGQREAAEFLINTIQLSEIADGALTLSVSGYNPLAAISVVESVYAPEGSWYLLPKPGTTSRPVLDKLSLIGHESAELRVENLTGNYSGGGVVPPFEGSFDTDQANFRVRVFGRGVLWSPDSVIWSDGTGGGGSI